MAQQVYTNVKTWFGGYDVTGDMNALTLSAAADVLDATVFGQDTRVHQAGLKRYNAELTGFFRAATVEPKGIDDLLFAAVGGTYVPWSFSPVGGADGDLAFMFPAVAGRYSPGAAVGELVRFTARAEAEAELVRGTILNTAARTTTGSGTARQLGALSATQRMLLAVHVTAVAGTPTLTLKLQSDDANGMATPTDRITWTPTLTAGVPTWHFASVAGAVTDTWWRLNWTIGGGSPSITFTGVAGIATATS